MERRRSWRSRSQPATLARRSGMSAGKLGARGGVRMHNDVARAMMRHDWPMNVRELEKPRGVAHILADDVITTDDLPPALAARSANVPDAAAAPSKQAALDGPSDLRTRLVALLARHEGTAAPSRERWRPRARTSIV